MDVKTPTRRLRQLLSRHYRISYSQDSEDLLVASLFQHTEHGFYVDVGCHHPIRYSNTKLFYDRGWRGINIDATPGVKELFDRHRRRDINVHAAIADRSGTMELAVFDESAINTLTVTAGARTVTVPAFPLAEVLKRWLPTEQPIDFLSVDVEGWDLQVLMSNDWTRYRPRVLVVEYVGVDLRKICASPMVEYLYGQGYVLYARSPLSLILKERDFFPPYVDRSAP